jgi:hypothetical protein
MILTESREKARMPRPEEWGSMAKMAFSLEEAPCGPTTSVGGSTGFFTEIETFFLSNTSEGPARGIAEHLSGKVSRLLNKIQDRRRRR